MQKKAPQKAPVLAPSSPVHWDVKNITRANHCLVTNHVLEIGEPLVVRIVKVHLRGSREEKKKKKNQSITKFLISYFGNQERCLKKSLEFISGKDTTYNKHTQTPSPSLRQC